ncbi:MAG TPA: Gfo/Idh/MocA family oxidoreductase [Verrucomicrobiae bacterium]|nr:Gfo/Idh/MocA family oxidoreductase [Verrucomicrobiae bacterium]
MKKYFLVLVGVLFVAANLLSQPASPPVRIAIVGLVHDHAWGFIPRFNGRTDVQLVGIVETNQDLIQRYSRAFHLDPGLFYPSLDALFARTNVQAVAIFTSILDHTRVVKICAARGVDVMMEKPMATNMKEAREIAAVVKKSGIQLVVNYETSWYPGNVAAYRMVHDEHQIGEIHRMVFRDGHYGPKEIGCSTNFLAWLTDPILDGGGAINDFGCYGADLATWFMDGQKPLSVFAVARHLKPDIYPKVEDDATILLKYPAATVVLEPSWNWPMNVKDMRIYGQSGYVYVPQPNLLNVRLIKDANETNVTPPPLTAPNDDPLSYLAAVARGDIKPSGLASLDVNLTVVEILDAAHKSARTGKEVKL